MGSFQWHGQCMYGIWLKWVLLFKFFYCKLHCKHMPRASLFAHVLYVRCSSSPNRLMMTIQQWHVLPDHLLAFTSQRDNSLHFYSLHFIFFSLFRILSLHEENINKNYIYIPWFVAFFMHRLKDQAILMQFPALYYPFCDHTNKHKTEKCTF